MPLASSLTLTVPAADANPSLVSLASPRPQNAFPARQPRPRPRTHAHSLLPAPGRHRVRLWAALLRTRTLFRPPLGAAGHAFDPQPGGSLP